MRVCDRWRGDHGFENFLADMGPRPTERHQLDRYPDNDGNYEPKNCRWATPKQNARNTRRNVVVEFRGRKLPLIEWANVVGIPYSTLRQRYYVGWGIERMLTEPVGSGRRMPAIKLSKTG